MITVRAEAMVELAEICTDDAEVLALSAIRMIAAGYSTGDVNCWDMAYSGAERVLVPEAAGRLVACLTMLVRALRTERVDEWHFMPVTCCRVTRDEAKVLRLLRAARAGAAQPLLRAASDVAGTALSPHLQASAEIVARVLDEVSEALVSGARQRQNASARLH